MQQGVLLNIPPFRIGNHQLSAAETTATRRIASLRIHVEQAIGRIKKFKLFACPIPLQSLVLLTKHYMCAVCSLSFKDTRWKNGLGTRLYIENTMHALTFFGVTV